MSEVSGLGRSRLASVQQLGRGLQQDSQARRRDDALSRLWEDLSCSIRTREQVRLSQRFSNAGQQRCNVQLWSVCYRTCILQRSFISSITMWTS